MGTIASRGLVGLLALVATLTPIWAGAADVNSIFETTFTDEQPVLSPIAAARFAREASATGVRLVAIRGGIGTPGSSPLPQIPRPVVVGQSSDETGRIVHFKVVRGPTNPPDEVAAGATLYEMYVCFLDNSGHLLVAVSMGEQLESFIPECGGHTTSALLEPAEGPMDDATVLEMHAAQGVAVKTMRLLKRYPFVTAFATEHAALLAPHASTKKLHKGRRYVASNSVIILGANGEAVPNGTRLSDLSNLVPSESAAPEAWVRGQRHAAEAHAAPIHGLGNLAEHSATYTALYHEQPAPLGSFSSVVYNCNHGRCPWEMTFRYLVFSEPRAATHVHNWFCQTTYNPTSIWGHNCNDDTVCTTRSVRLNVHWDAFGGTPCNDPYIRRYAPGPFE